MTHFGICEKCGQPVTSSPAYPVTGWEISRGQGGANMIKNRERIPDRVRHAHHVPDPKVNEDQESML